MNYLYKIKIIKISYYIEDHIVRYFDYTVILKKY